MSADDQVNRHYGRAGLLARIEAGLRAAGKNLDALTVEDLAPVDAFHTRGFAATLEVAQLADLSPDHYVLDVGCGLGGTARYIAQTYGCPVTGLDRTGAYIDAARKLTERVGLGKRIAWREGSALAMPFEAATFDVVWTEHVQMNIADKAGFYGESARVLKPDGRLVFHDIFRGSGEAPVFPLPWAETSALSWLATEAEARAAIAGAGLDLDTWEDRTADAVAFFDIILAKIARDGPPPLGSHLLMGDNAAQKLGNYARALREKRVTAVVGRAAKG